MFRDSQAGARKVCVHTYVRVRTKILYRALCRPHGAGILAISLLRQQTEDLQEFYKMNLPEATQEWARDEWLQTCNQADHGDGAVQRLPMTIFD